MCAIFVWSCRGRTFSFCTEVFVEFKAQLMNGEAMARSLKRIAHEILERNRGSDGVASDQ